MLWVVLATGWLLMPLTLVASLSRPRLRYALVLPASMVSIGLVAVCVGRLPEHPASAAGWVLVTAGVALGGGLGLWLWYRLLPVPARLDRRSPAVAGRSSPCVSSSIVAGLILVAIAGEPDCRLTPFAGGNRQPPAALRPSGPTTSPGPALRGTRSGCAPCP